MRFLKPFIAAVAVQMCGMPALAQDWSAVVIGQTGADAPMAFADAFHARKALQDGGIVDVDMLRDKPKQDVLSAIAGIKGDIGAMIYVSAPLTRRGTGIVLKDGTLSFEALMDAVAAAGVLELVMMIENCPGAGQSLRLPSDTFEMATFLAASAGPGEVCIDTGERLTDLLQVDVNVPTPLDQLLGAVWVSSDLAASPMLRPSAERPEPVVTVLGAAKVQETVPVVSRAAVSMLAPLPVAPVSTARNQPAEPLAFFPATASSRPAALPLAEGLPQPSIIVGIVTEATRASFSPAVTSGDVTGTEISYDNLTARRTIRGQDPALFATLVESGAFDPPADVMAAALQTELARMGCYNAAIDGIWGRGSRASVTRYFDERDGAEPVSLEPVAGLFRQVILEDDVTCPEVAAAAASSAPAARTTTATPRRTTRQQAAPRRQQQPASRTISNSNRLGVFR